MKLFSRDKADSVADRAAHGVAGGILKVQQSFAAYMTKMSSSWERKGKIIFLCSVCVVFAGLSVLAIVSSFSGEVVERPRSIKVIRHPEVEVLPRITKEEFERVQAFKAKLDSATMKARPGLMDSIRMVEEIFYSNK